MYMYLVVCVVGYESLHAGSCMYPSEVSLALLYGFFTSYKNRLTQAFANYIKVMQYNVHVQSMYPDLL